MRCLLCLLAVTLLFATTVRLPAAEPIPVIFDTDIGDDIDDTWALAMLLKCPQLDVKLVSTSCHKAARRGKLLAKLLTAAKRTDIPIALGPGPDGDTRQDAWIADYDLKTYPGKVHDDGVQAIIDTIRGSERPITVIAVGPVQTLAAALEKDPQIAKLAYFVGMHGSVHKGYNNSDKISPEYNVRRDAAAARRVLTAPWKRTTITPLDTCGIVHLEGGHFAALKKSDDPLVKALLENYRIWAKKDSVDQLSRSSTLFDTVAIYLALPGKRDLTRLESLNIAVTDDGFTRIDPAGAPMSVATSWTDLNAYRGMLVEILLREAP